MTMYLQIYVTINITSCNDILFRMECQSVYNGIKRDILWCLTDLRLFRFFVISLTPLFITIRAKLLFIFALQLMRFLINIL